MLDEGPFHMREVIGAYEKQDPPDCRSDQVTCASALECAPRAWRHKDAGVLSEAELLEKGYVVKEANQCTKGDRPEARHHAYNDGEQREPERSTREKRLVFIPVSGHSFQRKMIAMQARDGRYTQSL